MTYFDYERKDELEQAGLNKFESLVGRIIERVEGGYKGSGVIKLHLSDGNVGVMYHDQDCCEGVQVEDVCGDIAAIVGSPVLSAEEVSQSGSSEYDWDSDDDKRKIEGWPEGIAVPDYVSESFTWTFYKLSTIKGSVTIRWLGESNGYYSEGVDFYILPADEAESYAFG